MPSPEQIRKQKKKRRPNPLKGKMPPPGLLTELTDLISTMAIQKALKDASMAETMTIAAIIPEMLRELRKHTAPAPGKKPGRPSDPQLTKK